MSPALEVAHAQGDSNGCQNGFSPGFRSYLPDCRAYELVTPPYKEGFPVLSEGLSADGQQLLVSSFGTFAKPKGLGLLGQAYHISRTHAGWETSVLDAPFSTFPTYQVQAVSPDFQNSLLFARSPGQTWEDVYVRPSGGSFTRVGPGTPPGVVETGLNQFMGASDDLSRALFIDESPFGTDESRLWPGDTTVVGRLPSLYEYRNTGNSEPTLVGVSDGHTVVNGEQLAAGKLISDCGITLGSSPEGETYNAISAKNGETVYFTANASAICGAHGPPANEIYARVGARTIPISEPTVNDCTTCVTVSRVGASYRGASSDGSKVFFTTDQELLPGNSGMNLYKYDFNASAGDRITQISSGGVDPEVQGVARISQDGTHVYFVAKGVLTSAPNGNGDHPVAGGYNLYVGGTAQGSPSFIATLSFADAGDWGLEDFRPVQATPDGRILVFQSSADLTLDENGTIEAGQIFKYDIETGALVRISRGQNGYNNDGNSNIYPAILPIQNYERDQPTARFTHLALSSDGAYIFFSSSDALVPQAVTGVNNVYEYSEGRVALISDGHDSASIEEHPTSQLVGTDESGADVFFTTSDPLVPQDGDSQVDVYDARIGGGFLSPPALASCTGDPCQGGPMAPPTLAAAVTPTVTAEAGTQPFGSTIAAKSNTKRKSKPRKAAKPKRHKRRRARVRKPVGKKTAVKGK
jgi:hypothetical protein